MTSAQVVETSVPTNNSLSQDYTHPDDHSNSQSTTPGFKPLTLINVKIVFLRLILRFFLGFYLAMYYSVSIMEIGTALAATCIILNIYHRKTDMPIWFRKLVLGWLAPLVKCKPRCTSRAIMETQHEEAMINMMTFKTSDVRRNDMYEFDRESMDFDMDIMEANAQGRSNQRDQLAPNGSVPCNNLQRRRSMRGCQEEDNSNTDPLPNDPMIVHRLQLSERMNEEIRRKEWQDAARVLDRVLLVVSIVIGSASAMAIFLQSPRIRGLFIP